MSRKKKYGEHILMADIVGSAKADKETLLLFRKIIDSVNESFEPLSPLTITLGDEFQSVTQSLLSSLKIAIYIEEQFIHYDSRLRLRFAFGHGSIETDINSNIAHGMYGPVLTATRKLLEQSKQNKRKRFDFQLKDEELQNQIDDIMYVYQSFANHWKKKDLPIVSEFLIDRDYKEVAEKLKVRRDQIWKREKNLEIREYFAIKRVALRTAETYDSKYA